ncbi:MAG: hypothetical protein K6F71_02750 [Ruminococcus sp.]|uniref:hypothetical protein n=1 Tax=Ruminococcus sp. TaxID=41978 RepID=UPI0025E9843B|nr:hypothetical protein [Ruminococcus sp.]MCR5539746.1 hypothetical protein [Ruminococcus sp.]
MDFTVRLVEKNIAITSIYDQVKVLCRDYLTEHAADFSVTVSPEDIAREHKQNRREAEIERIREVEYPESYLETLAVYRKIVVQMLEYDTFLMHGAVVAVGERAWLFTAHPGTGKTTHIRLWLDNIEGSYVVNGDKPLIQIGEQITVFGTPWSGKEGMNKNIGVKLCGIVLLERGAENCINALSFSEALPTLIQQSYRPKDKQQLSKTLALIGKLSGRVPMYRLQCNMLPDAAFTAYSVLSAE